MKYIPLRGGVCAIVDDADFETLSAFTWFVHPAYSTTYVHRMVYKEDGTRTTRYMHRDLFPGARMVDHINGNGLDNRRENLRPATNRENQGNSEKQQGVSSRFKGVCWVKSKGRWTAYIKTKKRLEKLGYFDDETQAAKAYNMAAIEVFGEFARLNKLDDKGEEK